MHRSNQTRNKLKVYLNLKSLLYFIRSSPVNVTRSNQIYNKLCLYRLSSCHNISPNSHQNADAIQLAQ